MLRKSFPRKEKYLHGHRIGQRLRFNGGMRRNISSAAAALITIVMTIGCDVAEPPPPTATTASELDPNVGIIENPSYSARRSRQIGADCVRTLIKSLRPSSRIALIRNGLPGEGAIANLNPKEAIVQLDSFFVDSAEIGSNPTAAIHSATAWLMNSFRAHRRPLILIVRDDLRPDGRNSPDPARLRWPIGSKRIDVVVIGVPRDRIRLIQAAWRPSVRSLVVVGDDEAIQIEDLFANLPLPPKGLALP